MNKFETINTDELAQVGGGINIGALAQGLGSFFGQKGEAIGGQIGQIAGGIQNLIGMFRGGGQAPQGGAEG
jgi:bacteriocin-like protein